MTKDAKTVNGELQHVDLKIDRWESRLKRAVNTLDKLKRKRKRLAKIAFAGPAKAEHKPRPRPTKPAPILTPIESKKPAEIKATFKPIEPVPFNEALGFKPRKQRRTPDDLRAELDARKDAVS